MPPVADPESIIVLHPGYATGDIWAVATYMILNPKVCVAITRLSAGSSSTKNDQADRLAAYLRYVLPADQSNRVLTVDLTTLSGNINQRTPDVDMQALVAMMTSFKGGSYTPEGLGVIKSQVNRELKKIQKANGVPELAPINDSFWIGPGYVTRRCADAFLENPAASRTRLRAAWKVDNRDDQDIAAWLRSRGVPERDRRVVVLWARWTGKAGETKPEHDTSFRGLQQMRDIALKRSDQIVLITGDTPDVSDWAGSGSRTQKIFNIAAANRRVFDLTGFWNDSFWNGGNSEADKAAARFKQFRLWDYFHRNYKKDRHLGFRSGNLEALALIGCNVRYFEETNPDPSKRPAGSARMDCFNDPGIGYERLTLERVPTRTGQYTIDNPSGLVNGMPAWLVTEGQTKPEMTYEKGFGAADLIEIEKYLNPADTYTPSLTPRSSSPVPAMVAQTQSPIIADETTGLLFNGERTAKPIWQALCGCCVIQ